MTLVPSMAKTAAQVTMLQRSPTYIVAKPGADAFANKLGRWLPAKWAYRITRWKNIAMNTYFYNLSRSKPEKVSAAIIAGAKAQLGAGYDVETHFTPSYKPWDQRVCLVPDGDLFRSIRSGETSIMTGKIDRFTENGIRLENGEELPADVIVTATRLKMQLLSNVQLFVDGKLIEFAKTFNYKGTMFSGIPNFALTMGYSNAPWTLKSELTGRYVCRLINYMDRRGLRSAVPRAGSSVGEQPMFGLTSGYVQRALDHLPKQGLKKPWALRQNYTRDVIDMRFGKMKDGALQFSR